jgi:hypothetical protein
MQIGLEVEAVNDLRDRRMVRQLVQRAPGRAARPGLLDAQRPRLRADRPERRGAADLLRVDAERRRRRRGGRGPRVVPAIAETARACCVARRARVCCGLNGAP